MARNCLILILLVHSAAALALTHLTFKFGKETRPFESTSKSGVWISDHCSENPARCAAYTEYLKLEQNRCPVTAHLDEAPGTPICEEAQGDVMVAKDHKGHTVSFCQFGDGTMINLGAFSRYCKK